MIFKVSHFSVMKASKDLTLLSARGGAHRLQKAELIAGLQVLAQHHGQRLKEQEIRKIFASVPDDSGTLLDYLRDQLKVLTECFETPLQKLAFYTDSNFIKAMIESHFAGDSQYKISFPQKAEKFNKDTLIAVYNEQYNPELIKKLMGENPNNPIIHSYLYERYFIIDSLYIGNESLPCHFCNALNSDDAAINGDNRSAVDYAGLYRRMLNDHQYVMRPLPISDMDRCQILSILFPKIHALLSPDEPFLSEDRYSIYYTTKLDIRRRSISRDVAHHHPTCECITVEAT